MRCYHGLPSFERLWRSQAAVSTTRGCITRKQTETKGSKIASAYFLLFPFISSNRDFSKGYGRKKQKNSRLAKLAFEVVKRAVSDACLSFSLPARKARKAH